MVIWFSLLSYLLQILFDSPFNHPLLVLPSVYIYSMLQWFLTFLRSWAKWRRWWKLRNPFPEKCMCGFMLGSHPSLGSLYHWFPSPLAGCLCTVWLAYLVLMWSLPLTSLLPSPWPDHPACMFPKPLSCCLPRCAKIILLILQDYFRAQGTSSSCWAVAWTPQLSNGLGKWSVLPMLGFWLHMLVTIFTAWGRKGLLIAWVRNLLILTGCIGLRFKYTSESVFLSQIKLCPKDLLSKMTLLWNLSTLQYLLDNNC